MAYRLRIAIIAAVGIIGTARSSWAEQGKVTKISSTEHVGQWAVAEASGRIFASLPEADRIVEYDPATGESVRKFSLPGGPLQLMIKSRWLVATCPKTNSMGLIDLKTNKVTGSVPLAGRGLNCIFCSKADNAYVYGICSNDSPPRGVEIVQVDCLRQAVRKRSAYSGPYSMLHASMSADGNWVVGDGRGGGSPSGADLLSADEDAAAFKVLTHIHESFGQIVADPTGRWWTLGEKLYPVDLTYNGSAVLVRSSPLRMFAGSPVAVHPARDLAVSVSSAGNALVFQAFSDGSHSKTIKLERGENAADVAETPRPNVSRLRRGSPRVASGRLASDPCLAFDLVHDRVIYAAGDQAFVLPIADELAATAKRLAIAGAPSLKVVMAQTRRVRFSVADGGAAAWTIESGPAFAKFNGDELLISPTAANLGHYDIGVKATRDALSDSITFALDVGVPDIDLGFHIQNMVLDPAGKTALAWGQKQTPRVGYDPEAATKPTQFALVDLDDLKVLATQTVKAGIQLACLDDKYIYMVLASGNVLYRLDRADLSNRKRLFLNGQPSRLEILPGGQVAIKTADSAPYSSTQVYDRETLARNPKHFAQMDPSIGVQESLAIAEQGMDGTLVFREKIVDAATGETRCALEFNALPALADAMVRENHMPPGHEARTALWARTLPGQMLAGVQGSRIAQFRGIAAISAFDPLAACVRQEQDNRHVKKILEFHEIKAGEIIRSVDLGESEQGRGGMEYYGGYPSSPLQITKDKVVYHDGSRLLACPIPAEVKKKAAVPLALKVPKIPVASVAGPVEVQFSTHGDEGPRTYALTKEYEGLSIDAVQGKVTIDLSKIWKNYLAGGAKPANPYGGYVAPGTQQPDTGAIFERLTGTPLEAGKTAFRLPLRVAVTNPTGESDELRLSVIVTAPKDEVEKATARQQAEMAAQQAKAGEEMLRRQEEQNRLNAARLGQPPAAGPDADRITQLENRVRRVEASLDAVLQKLDRMERARNGEEKRDGPSPVRK